MIFFRILIIRGLQQNAMQNAFISAVYFFLFFSFFFVVSHSVKKLSLFFGTFLIFATLRKLYFSDRWVLFGSPFFSVRFHCFTVRERWKRAGTGPYGGYTGVWTVSYGPGLTCVVSALVSLFFTGEITNNKWEVEIGDGGLSLSEEWCRLAQGGF